VEASIPVQAYRLVPQLWAMHGAQLAQVCRGCPPLYCLLAALLPQSPAGLQCTATRCLQPLLPLQHVMQGCKQQCQQGEYSGVVDSPVQPLKAYR
jgi:hypothetical protein